jgi:hypothetical protein
MQKSEVYMENLEYVKAKLDSGLFNVGVVVNQTKISRYLINKIINGVDVDQYIVDGLANYFKKAGE